MKKFIASFALVLFVAFSVMSFAPAQAEASRRVSGYTRSNGTYVQPYYRSNSNSMKYDNYSARGNYNPYTGKKGYTAW